jgi:hypothetical protein
MINDDFLIDYDELNSIIKVHHLIIQITVQTLIIAISRSLIVPLQISAPFHQDRY